MTITERMAAWLQSTIRDKQQERERLDGEIAAYQSALSALRTMESGK